MLESWVDDVLTYSQGQQQQVHTSQGTVRGAAAAGLARQQLLAAGLAAGTVEQLYRCLYVYSMGFVDTIKVRSAEAKAGANRSQTARGQKASSSVHVVMSATGADGDGAVTPTPTVVLHGRSCWGQTSTSRSCCRQSGGPSWCLLSTA